MMFWQVSHAMLVLIERRTMSTEFTYFTGKKYKTDRTELEAVRSMKSAATRVYQERCHPLCSQNFANLNFEYMFLARPRQVQSFELLSTGFL